MATHKRGQHVSNTSSTPHRRTNTLNGCSSWCERLSYPGERPSNSSQHGVPHLSCSFRMRQSEGLKKSCRVCVFSSHLFGRRSTLPLRSSVPHLSVQCPTLHYTTLHYTTHTHQSVSSAQGDPSAGVTQDLGLNNNVDVVKHPKLKTQQCSSTCLPQSAQP